MSHIIDESLFEQLCREMNIVKTPGSPGIKIGGHPYLETIDIDALMRKPYAMTSYPIINTQPSKRSAPIILNQKVQNTQKNSYSVSDSMIIAA